MKKANEDSLEKLILKVDTVIKILKGLWKLKDRKTIAKLFNPEVIPLSLQSEIVYAAEVDWLLSDEDDGFYNFLLQVYNYNL